MSESNLSPANFNNQCAAATAVAQPKSAVTRPRHTVRALEGAYEVGILLPGVKREDIRVRLEENLLAVEASRPEVTPEGWRPLRREIEPTDYRLELEVSVPVDAARISASLEEGVLSLRLPLREEAKARDIPVT
ncbi:MAG: Hsp20/alpha crystallin family protein [Verrucomicrobiales bacterium]